MNGFDNPGFNVRKVIPAPECATFISFMHIYEKQAARDRVSERWRKVYIGML